jgi:hypothetical protein
MRQLARHGPLGRDFAFSYLTEPDRWNSSPSSCPAISTTRPLKTSSWAGPRLAIPLKRFSRKRASRFPWVCAEHVNYILGWIKRMQVLNAVAELSMSREITRTIKKRRKHIRELEATMKQKAEIPLSMHNLYRGLLRDHESMCYKLQQRDIKLQSERMKLEERRARDVDKSRQELIKSLYRKPVNEKSPMDYQGDEEDEEQSPPPAPSKNGSGLGMFSLFVGFCLSLLFIRCSNQGSAFNQGSRSETTCFNLNRNDPILYRCTTSASEGLSSPKSDQIRCSPSTVTLHATHPQYKSAHIPQTIISQRLFAKLGSPLPTSRSAYALRSFGGNHPKGEIPGHPDFVTRLM